jgi:hypothetical protein
LHGARVLRPHFHRGHLGRGNVLQDGVHALTSSTLRPLRGRPRSSMSPRARRVAARATTSSGEKTRV